MGIVCYEEVFVLTWRHVSLQASRYCGSFKFEARDSTVTDEILKYGVQRMMRSTSVGTVSFDLFIDKGGLTTRAQHPMPGCSVAMVS